jgi:hypothetical protein
MKYLDSFNKRSINESFKNSDEDILMFFTDYYDENPDNFNVKNVLVFDNKKVVSETLYMKEPSKYRKAKVITIRVSKPNGIESGTAKYLTTIEPLQRMLSDIERFYEMSGEEINYKIKTDFDGLSIEFLVLGEQMKDDQSKQKTIDELFNELKGIYKEKGYRPSIKGNWFELKTSAKKKYSSYGDFSIELRRTLGQINSGAMNLDNARESYKSLIEWRNKVHQNGMTMNIGGGDHQVVISLKNQ